MAKKSPAEPEEFEDPLSNYDPVEYGTELARVLGEEPVTRITSRPYAEVTSDTPIKNAIHTLHGLKVSSLLVVDEGKLVGIFTERDVLEKVAERYAELADHPLSKVMTVEPLVVYEIDPAGAALAAIAAGGYRHVPLLSTEGEVLGIISPRRVFEYLASHF